MTAGSSTPRNGSHGGGPGLDALRETLRGELRRASDRLVKDGLARPTLDGKLLRPLMAFLSVPRGRRRLLDERFWLGALAIEMVHEASLLHDDVLDEASERRGRPTVFASAGVGAALVLGDHLLTSAYRAAAETESPTFLRTFVDAVERTVAGEIAQEKATGRPLQFSEYTRNITGKSGELFRCAFSLGPCATGGGNPVESGRLGARVGRLYQMIDDLLDYCPTLSRGKPPLQDWRQRKWTWPLGLLEEWTFDLGEMDILDRLYQKGPLGLSPMARGLEWVEDEVNQLSEELAQSGIEVEDVRPLLRSWLDLARTAVAGESVSEESKEADSSSVAAGSTTPPEKPSVYAFSGTLEELAEPLSTPRARLEYFGRHARSFRFAARLFPSDDLERVATVYAFCRFTDDLVDEARDDDPARLATRLAEWRALARRAYEGEVTGVGMVDDAMSGMRSAVIPFHYADELIAGVGMDLEPRSFPTLDALRVYSYRVASTVGGWLTELFGVHDPRVLDRAFALGHAMQLTNILRDVGEDLSDGRLYLPRDRMAAHGVDRALLEAMMEKQSPALPGYRNLLEELMAEADADYARAFEAIRFLPKAFRGPVAVAASVYQGIHDEIRRNAYDNLHRRARTGVHRKVLLAIRGLRRLRRTQNQALPLSMRSRLDGGNRSPEDGSEVAA